MAEEDRGGPGGDKAADLGFGGGGVYLRGGRGAGIRAPENGGTLAADLRARALVQPVRPARHLDGHHASQGSRGQFLLPSLLHGTDPGRWLAEVGVGALPARHGDLPVVPLRGSPARRGSRVDAQAWG